MGRERPTGMVFSGGQLRWEAPVRGRESGTAQAMAWSDVPAGEGLPAELLRELPTQGGCLVALSGAEVMLRPAVFPTIETDELAGMVELQVDQISPFSADESTRSYEVVAQREGHSHVIIGICRTARVEATAGGLRRSGIVVERIESELLSYWSALAEGGHLDAERREVVLLLNDAGLYLIIQERGLPLVLALQATPEELADPSLADELRQTVAHELTGLEVQHGPAAAGYALLVCGDAAALAPFGAAVGEVCACAPRPLALDALGSISRLLVERGAGLAVGTPMDLTPQSWRDEDRALSFRSRLWRGSLAAVALWAVIVGAGIAALLYQNFRVTSLQRRLASISGPVARVKAARDEVEMIKRYTDRSYSVLECLRVISLSQPKGIDLSDMTYRKGMGVELTGEADSSTLSSRFLEALNRAEIFESVSSGPTTQTGKGRYRFGIEIRLKGEQDET